MFIIITKAPNASNCEQQFIGPFWTYDAAESFFCRLPAGAEYFEHKYIQELTPSCDILEPCTYCAESRPHVRHETLR